MTYKIEKNIPIPIYYWREFPFEQMLVGDSFFIPHKAYSNISFELMAKRLRGGIIASASRVLEHKYKSRARVEKGIKGLRVWRVE